MKLLVVTAGGAELAAGVPGCGAETQHPRISGPCLRENRLVERAGETRFDSIPDVA